MKIRFVDLLWSNGYIFKDSCPRWSGYMSSKVNHDKVLRKSYVSVLPIIDLHATDTTALYSLLSFLEEQCKKLNIPVACVLLTGSCTSRLKKLYPRRKLMHLFVLEAFIN